MSVDFDDAYRVMLRRRVAVVLLCSVGVCLLAAAALTYSMAGISSVLPLVLSIFGFVMVAIGAWIKFVEWLKHVRPSQQASRLLDEL